MAVLPWVLDRRAFHEENVLAPLPGLALFFFGWPRELGLGAES